MTMRRGSDMGARLPDTASSELLTVEQMCALHPAAFTSSAAAVRPAAPALPPDWTPLPVIDAAALKTGTPAHESWVL